MLHMSSTAQATIHQLHKIFSAHGLSEQLITDNDPQFAAEEFKTFARQGEYSIHSLLPITQV